MKIYLIWMVCWMSFAFLNLFLIYYSYRLVRIVRKEKYAAFAIFNLKESLKAFKVLSLAGIFVGITMCISLTGFLLQIIYLEFFNVGAGLSAFLGGLYFLRNLIKSIKTLE
ncbi:MAG: hypothetical protein QMD14_06120 [Candidatus Aenigmarchaeota archaeon]|nr:hypothetical protein [Candidatus Aenigmarchaeota archaeon]